MTRLVVRVQPGARRSGFTGWFGEHPKLAVTAPPSEGRANDEARAVIADALGVHRRQVRLVIGGASRTKHFEIDGIDADTLSSRLEAVLAGR